jgi:hypothetical protein
MEVMGVYRGSHIMNTMARQPFIVSHIITNTMESLHNLSMPLILHANAGQVLAQALSYCF